MFLLLGNFIILILYALFSVHAKSDDEIFTPVPIVGVVAQEMYAALQNEFPAYSCFIVATHVKALESSGARVVPIVINKDELYYKKVLRSINGVILPGGYAHIGAGNPYYDTVRVIYKIAKKMNDEGTFFPILGVCLGFEFLITIANDDESILTKCNTFYENLSLNMFYTPTETKLFSLVTNEQLHALRNLNVTFNWHTWCASVENFLGTNLHDWIITSTSFNHKGEEFIASVESKNYPFFGIQFHPEKVPYDWKMAKLYSREAISANRYFYDFFVSLAARNDQKFDDANEEKRWSFARYPVVHGEDDSFGQLYLF